MRTRSALVAVTFAGVVVAVVALAGCAAGTAPRATVLPTPGITSSTSAPATRPDASPTTSTTSSATPGTDAPSAPAPEQAVACSDDIVSVSGPSGTYSLRGPCGRVTVAGTGIILATDGGAIDTLLIQGDGNTVSGRSAVSTTTVEGQSNTIDVQRTDTLTLRGQRNSVTSADTITRLDIAGADNTVAAPRVGTATVSGDGNAYPGS